MRTAPSDSPKGGAWDALKPLRLFKNTKVREFCLAKRGSKSGFGRPMGPLLHRNNGPAVLQRRPRQNAIAAPLRCRKALIATPRGPYGKPKLPLWGSQRGLLVCKYLCDNNLQKQRFFRRKKRPDFDRREI